MARRAQKKPISKTINSPRHTGKYIATKAIMDLLMYRLNSKVYRVPSIYGAAFKADYLDYVIKSAFPEYDIEVTAFKDNTVFNVEIRRAPYILFTENYTGPSCLTTTSLSALFGRLSNFRSAIDDGTLSYDDVCEYLGVTTRALLDLRAMLYIINSCYRCDINFYINTQAAPKRKSFVGHVDIGYYCFNEQTLEGCFTATVSGDYTQEQLLIIAQQLSREGAKRNDDVGKFCFDKFPLSLVGVDNYD